MKRPFASILTLLILLTARIILGSPIFAESVNSLNPLYQALPAAKFREVADWEKLKDPQFPLIRTQGVFNGYSEKGDLMGIVVHLASQGYGGPIDLLVVFNPAGTIAKVQIFKHSETDCHVTGMTKGNFLSQFLGITLKEKISLLIGLPAQKRGDIQAMTGGTVTSKAVTEAAAEARVVFYRLNHQK